MNACWQRVPTLQNEQEGGGDGTVTEVDLCFDEYTASLFIYGRWRFLIDFIGEQAAHSFML